MISGIEDGAGSAESSAMKNMALDHLGGIAARLKGFQVESDIPSLDQVSSQSGEY